MMPIPLTYWAITVAIAAPFTPRFKPATNQISKPIFKIAEIARKTKGISELPKERNNDEK